MQTKWSQIAGDLRQEIRSGQYPPGSTLPPLHVLMARFGVARDTVRDAVHSLQSEGLVFPRRGAGTIVLEHHNDDPDTIAAAGPRIRREAQIEILNELADDWEKQADSSDSAFQQFADLLRARVVQIRQGRPSTV